MNRDVLLFIVEGEDREINLLNFVKQEFLCASKETVTIVVPAGMNIYMLYALMKEEGFFLDIVELLREKIYKAKEALKGYNRDSFSGIYLFFDFDEHSNNLGLKSEAEYLDALEEMITHFNDPTEDGKLYISYPMIEAFRDFVSNSCSLSSLYCFLSRESFGEYKQLSSSSIHQNVSKYHFPEWKDMTVHYMNRCCCLLNINGKLDRDIFLSFATQLHIFKSQKALYIKVKKIFVLSGLPAFLLEYSSLNYRALVGRRTRFETPTGCIQRDLE